ncbi:hypothetical protein [Roseibium algae]|uniref:Uncharacterized protein n=1 Tax=Roseibium algae TaxID=3123038 RepID=A0ABU8THX1_9HYPH
MSIDQVVSRKLLQMAANGSVHALSNAVNEINAAQRLQQKQIDEDVDLAIDIKSINDSCSTRLSKMVTTPRLFYLIRTIFKSLRVGATGSPVQPMKSVSRSSKRTAANATC